MLQCGRTPRSERDVYRTRSGAAWLASPTGKVALDAPAEPTDAGRGELS